MFFYKFSFADKSNRIFPILNFKSRKALSIINIMRLCKIKQYLCNGFSQKGFLLRRIYDCRTLPKKAPIPMMVGSLKNNCRIQLTYTSW